MEFPQKSSFRFTRRAIDLLRNSRPPPYSFYGVRFHALLQSNFFLHICSFNKDEDDGKVHVTSVTTVSSNSVKFVPTYDSSIPLNPWSKVSMSGYMVSRVKKTLPALLDKIILKITHVIEKMAKSEE